MTYALFFIAGFTLGWMTSIIGMIGYATGVLDREEELKLNSASAGFKNR